MGPLPLLAGAALALIALGALLFPKWSEKTLTSTEDFNSLEQIMEGYLQLHGGAENIRMVKSLKSSGVFTQGEDTIDFVIIKKRPNLLRVIYEQPRRKIVNGYDGELAWQYVESKVNFLAESRLLQGSAAESLQNDSRFDNPLIQLDGNWDNYRFNGQTTYQGTTYYEIQLETGSLSNDKIILLETNTLLDTIHIDRDNQTGEETITIFSDHKPVQGVHLPFSIQRVKAGTLIWSISLSNIQINLGIPNSLFQVPPSS